MSLAVLAIAACSKEDAITEGGKSQQLNVLTSIQRSEEHTSELQSH